jgi:hypothetical protein
MQMLTISKAAKNALTNEGLLQKPGAAFSRNALPDEAVRDSDEGRPLLLPVHRILVFARTRCFLKKSKPDHQRRKWRHSFASFWVWSAQSSGGREAGAAAVFDHLNQRAEITANLLSGFCLKSNVTNFFALCIPGCLDPAQRCSK